VEHPERWHRDQFRQHGPFGLRHRHGHGGPLRREPADRLGGGVAAGIAAWRGFSPTAVRIVFVLATLVSAGWGLPLYVLAWLFIPAVGTDANIFSKARNDTGGIRLAVGLASLLIFVLLIAGALNGGWFISWAWPQVFSVGWLFSAHASLALLHPLGGVLLVIAAIVLALGPWWLRIARDLAVERQAKARAEERVDIAARIHDSVLQTLALIQRRADDPQKVIQLARLQERELRSWLFEGRSPDDAEEITVADGVRQIQQDIESRYGVPVEAVTVGDCDLDENLSALLAAAREATVNAAKWSGASVISLFAEVEPVEVSIVVRDRGKGFDPGSVPEDRKGLAESVHGRMTRRGGTATVTSAPGEGTKVTLKMPRSSLTAGRS